MNKQTKNLVLGNITIKDETLARIYGLDEYGIRCLKKNLKRLYNNNCEIKDFDSYTAEEIEDIRRTAKERHVTLQEIIDNIDKKYNFNIKVIGIREELLNKVPEERDFDEIITLLCNVEGMTLNCIKVYREALYNATSYIVKARFRYSDPAKTEKYDFDRWSLGGEVDTRKNTAYIALLVNEFIRLSRLTTDDKDALREILKRKQGLSAEEKLLEVYKFLIKMMKSCMTFDTSMSLFTSRDARLLVRYGIKERRFITKEVLETIESLDEE